MYRGPRLCLFSLRGEIPPPPLCRTWHPSDLSASVAGLEKLNLNKCGEMTASWLAPHLRKLVNLTHLAIGRRKCCVYIDHQHKA